jgi:putative hydrolase of the HAD superfamily
MNTQPPSQLPPGLLLDLDDTILTYDLVSADAWRRACAQHSGRCGVPAEELYTVLGEVRAWYWSDPERHRQGRLRLEEARAELTLLGLQRLGVDDAALASALSTSYRDERDAAIDFFPGAREALEGFVRRGVRLALMTNGQSEHQRAKLERFDLERFFEVICIEGEMGFGKPDRRVFETALQGLSLRPEEVWAVGDNLEWDVAGPQNLGIYGIWNDYRRHGLPEGSAVRPDRVICSLAELLE